MQFEWKVGTHGNRCTHWSQKTTDYSARGKVRGELYSVFQKSINQLSQHIIVGCYSTMVVHFSVKETAEGSTPSNIQKRKV
jgi:hypothetical protein